MNCNYAVCSVLQSMCGVKRYWSLGFDLMYQLQRRGWGFGRQEWILTRTQLDTNDMALQTITEQWNVIRLTPQIASSYKLFRWNFIWSPFAIPWQLKLHSTNINYCVHAYTFKVSYFDEIFDTWLHQKTLHFKHNWSANLMYSSCLFLLWSLNFILIRLTNTALVLINVISVHHYDSIWSDHAMHQFASNVINLQNQKWNFPFHCHI